jgi:glycosyltransferase involved in cell wall biosynthesis
MRILLGAYDVAGWMTNLRIGFEKLGHTVTTTTVEKHDFYQYEYSYYLQDHWPKKVPTIPKHRILRRVKRKLEYRREYDNYKKFVYRLIDEHDILIIVSTPLLKNGEEYQYAKLRNKPVISLFTGSDARYFNSFYQGFDISQWSFPEAFTNTDIEVSLKYIRIAEKYSDLVYSLPDQAGLQLRPYHHLQVPVNTSIIKPASQKEAVLKVLHAPSMPYKKGTDIIEATLEKLRSEGVNFDFITVRNMPHRELLDLLSTVDIVVDEIVYHGPGVLSFEAMCSGCVAATRYLENSPPVFRPPVWPIDAKSIYSQLKKLLTDTELVKKLKEKSLEYSHSNNSAEAVAGSLLNDLDSKRAPDYFPEFLVKEYKPCNREEVRKINKWTSFVRSEDWYRRSVQPVKREGLNF